MYEAMAIISFVGGYRSISVHVRTGTCRVGPGDAAPIQLLARLTGDGWPAPYTTSRHNNVNQVESPDLA